MVIGTCFMGFMGMRHGWHFIGYCPVFMYRTVAPVKLLNWVEGLIMVFASDNFNICISHPVY